jgi:predicted transcriptional regulator
VVSLSRALTAFAVNAPLLPKLLSGKDFLSSEFTIQAAIEHVMLDSYYQAKIISFMHTVVGIRSSQRKAPSAELGLPDPMIWFDSWRQLAGVLSDENRQLLRTMSEAQPKTVAELAKLSGRAPSNLSRTLKNLEAHGLVRLCRTEGERAIRPEAISTAFVVLLE